MTDFRIIVWYIASLAVRGIFARSGVLPALNNRMYSALVALFFIGFLPVVGGGTIWDAPMGSPPIAWNPVSGPEYVVQAEGYSQRLDKAPRSELTHHLPRFSYPAHQLRRGNAGRKLTGSGSNFQLLAVGKDS